MVLLRLKETNREDLEAEWRFVRDMPENENGLTNSWHGISREEFAAVALPRALAWARGEDLPEGIVPETQFYLWAGGEIVGQFRLRHRLNEALRRGAGHIGYFIAAPFRGRGYGTEGLRLTLEKAFAVVPEEEIFLRLLRTNTASLRVMEKNGGRVVGEDGEHFYVRIPKPPRQAGSV